MSSSTISTHARGTASSLTLLSGESLERRLEQLLHQERFAPPAHFVAAESVNDASLNARAELDPDALPSGPSRREPCTGTSRSRPCSMTRTLRSMSGLSTES
jgi:hypothetical protein